MQMVPHISSVRTWARMFGVKYVNILFGLAEDDRVVEGTLSFTRLHVGTVVFSPPDNTVKLMLSTLLANRALVPLLSHVTSPTANKVSFGDEDITWSVANAGSDGTVAEDATIKAKMMCRLPSSSTRAKRRLTMCVVLF